MGSLEAEVKRETYISKRFLIIAIVIAILGTIGAHLAFMYTPGWTGVNNLSAGAIGLPYLVLFLGILIGNLFPEKVKGGHIALISAVTIMTVYQYYLGNTICPVFTHMLGNRMAPSPYKEAFSWVWGPELQYIQHITGGGVKVPWGAWAPVLMWWILFSFLWFLLNLSFMSIVRKRWIDVELLPFPQSYTWSIPLVSAKPERRLKGQPPETRLLWFLAGMVFGFFYMMPPLIKAIIPWFPDIYGWSRSPPYWGFWMGTIDAGSLPELGSKIAGPLAIPVNIVYYATALLAPLDILLTAGVTSLALLIICQIAYIRGFYSGVTKQGTIGRELMFGREYPLKLHAVYVGMEVSIIVFWIALNWRYFAETLKGVVKDTSKGEEEDVPYSILWTLFICSAVLIVLALYAAGAALGGAIVLLLFFFASNLSGARIAGLVPYVTSWCTALHEGTNLAFPLSYFYKDVVSVSDVTYSYVNTVAFGPSREIARLSNNAYAMGICYRIAKDADVRARDMFIVLFISGLIGSIVPWIFVTKWYYTFGMARTVKGVGDTGYVWWRAQPQFIRQYPATKPYWLQLIIGAVVIGVLSYLRMRFIWWPFDPVGVYVGWNYLFLAPTLWLVPWIVKYLVIKIGGMRLHDDILTPLVAGITVGGTLAWFVGAMAIMVRTLTG